MPSAKKAARSGLRRTVHAAAAARARVGAHGVPNLDLTEAQWQARVTTLASFYGWRWYHPPDNQPTINVAKIRKEFEARAKGGAAMSGREVLQRVAMLAHRQDVTPGFPDLTLVRHEPDLGPELLFWELKTETGRLGPGQAEWAEILGAIDNTIDAMEHPPTLPRVEHRIQRPRHEDLVHDRLARGRGRIEPAWFVGELD